MLSAKACATQTTVVQLGVVLFVASHAEVALCNIFMSGYSHGARFRSFLRNDVILNLVECNVLAHVALSSRCGVEITEVLDTVSEAERVGVVEHSDLISLRESSVSGTKRRILLVEP